MRVLPVVSACGTLLVTYALGRQENAYIILEQKDYNALELEAAARWRLVATRQVGHRAMRVYRTEAPNEPAP